MRLVSLPAGVILLVLIGGKTMRLLTAVSLVAGLSWGVTPAQAEGPAAVRVLLLASGPTREFQFCRRVFTQEAARQRAVLEVCLHSSDARAVPVPDVPAERCHLQFPAALDTLDVIIAFDPDWSQLSAAQLGRLHHWVTEQGGGLIVIAGPVHTSQLAEVKAESKLAPVAALLPVAVADSRRPPWTQRSLALPWRLHFSRAAAGLPFLQLDPAAHDPLAGWAEYFVAERHEARAKKVDAARLARLIANLDSNEFTAREQASQELGAIGWPAIAALEKALKERPSLEMSMRLEALVRNVKWEDLGRGFHTIHPVRSVKAAATVLGAFGDPDAQLANGDLHPYLVTMPAGKGKSVWLGSGEMWRLRTCRAAYHDRFWSELAQWARSH